jgi:hypothetical protein
MPSVFADQHMRDQSFGRQAGADQPLRRGCLDDGAGASAAAVFRATGDENTVRRRDDVEPLGFLLADHVHRPAATGARSRLRLDHHLDPPQMRRQRFALTRLGPRAPRRRSFLRRRLTLRAGNLAFFERELQLVGVEPLQIPAELRSLELPDELAHPLDPAEQFVALGDQRQRRQRIGTLAEVDRPRRDQHPDTGRNRDHRAAFTARSTSRRCRQSMPGATRITAPAISISTMPAGVGGDGAGSLGAATTGTNPSAPSDGSARAPSRASRRQA